MRAFSALLAAATLAQTSMAHYCFNRLIVNGNYTDEYEYVRKNNNSNSPVTNVNSTDLRCNSGGLLTGNVTSTYKLSAGAEVGFALDTAIGHPGPVQVYMSKAPGEASEYDGSGDWFKVHEIGVAEFNSSGIQWATNELQNFTFTLPEETPAGQYFLRVESIALHGAETYGGAQFYISCAQIEVTSSSDATPAPVVDIPGVYTGYEPGILIDIYYPVPTNYTMPGPALWPSNSTSTSNTTSAASSAVSSAAAASSVVASSSAVVVSSSDVAVSSSAVAVSSAVASSSTVAASSVPANNAIAASSASAVPMVSSFVGYNSTSPSGFQTVSSPAFASGTASPSGTGSSTTSSGTVKKYYQCGGQNYSGATTCESGSTCKKWSDFYSQCV